MKMLMYKILCWILPLKTLGYFSGSFPCNINVDGKYFKELIGVGKHKAVYKYKDYAIKVVLDELYTSPMDAYEHGLKDQSVFNFFDICEPIKYIGNVKYGKFYCNVFKLKLLEIPENKEEISENEFVTLMQSKGWNQDDYNTLVWYKDDSYIYDIHEENIGYDKKHNLKVFDGGVHLSGYNKLKLKYSRFKLGIY